MNNDLSNGTTKSHIYVNIVYMALASGEAEPVLRASAWSLAIQLG